MKGNVDPLPKCYTKKSFAAAEIKLQTLPRYIEYG